MIEFVPTAFTEFRKILKREGLMGFVACEVLEVRPTYLVVDKTDVFSDPPHRGICEMDRAVTVQDGGIKAGDVFFVSLYAYDKTVHDGGTVRDVTAVVQFPGESISSY